jgi:hypothetical protein
MCVTVGPSLPDASTPSTPAARYDTKMFSKPALQLISNVDVPLQNLYQEELKRPIKPFKQGSGADIGFFPRSILIGLFMVGIPSLCFLGYGAIRIVSYAYRNLVMRR